MNQTHTKAINLMKSIATQVRVNDQERNGIHIAIKVLEMACEELADLKPEVEAENPHEVVAETEPILETAK